MALQLYSVSRYSRLSLPLIRYMSLLPPPLYALDRPQVNYDDLSSIAMKLYTAGMDKVSSTVMVGNALKFNQQDRTLELFSNDFALKRLQPYNVETVWTSHALYHIDKNVHVVAVGKAVTGMCRAVEDMLGDEIVEGVAVIPEGCIKSLQDANKHHLIPSSRFEILAGGDGRTPSEHSHGFALRVCNMARRLKADDILITLISGGGSALLALPKSPLTLEDKMKLVSLMQAHKVTPLDQTIVRKNLSQIKGGGLSAIAFPAKVISLTLSDLTHAKFNEVGGGLTTPDSSTPQQALEILRKHNLTHKVPPVAMEVLHREAQEAKETKWYTDNFSFKGIGSGPKPRHDVSNSVNILAGSDEIAVGAILRQCAEYDMPARALAHSPVRRSTREGGELFACLAQYVASIMTRKCRRVADRELVHTELECIKLGMTKTELRKVASTADAAANMKKPICLVFTSEFCKDALEEGHGKGGPCQEVALATAIELKKRSDHHGSLKKCDVQLFSIDTDGIDGSNDAAGAIADCIQAGKPVFGRSAEEYLQSRDSFSFYANLDEGKYHIVTGATGTDIQNLQLLLIGNKAHEMSGQ